MDLQKGWNYVLNEYPEVCATFESELAFRTPDFTQIDRDRAVAAGASWGGYAIKFSLFLFLALTAVSHASSLYLHKLDPGTS